MPDSCPLCNGPMYSITTRRIGDVALCITCGDKVLPLINQVNISMFELIKRDVDNGLSVTQAVTEQLAWHTELTGEQCSIVRASL